MSNDDDLLRRFRARFERNKEKGRWLKKRVVANAHTPACLDYQTQWGKPHPLCNGDHNDDHGKERPPK